jgi:hypothetical protein
MAKLPTSEAAWHAVEATFAVYDGFAFAKQYDIEPECARPALPNRADLDQPDLPPVSVGTSSAWCVRIEPREPRPALASGGAHQARGERGHHQGKAEEQHVDAH